MKLAMTIVATAIVLAGCATEPFSYLDGRQYFRAQMNGFGASVASVDGKDYVQNPVRIEPGMHRITLQAPPAPGYRFGEKRTIELQVEPCQRYYFAGIRKSAISQDWEPKVDYVEPIAGCGAMKK